MASRSYKVLPIEEFGEHLLRSNDLDPIYCALHTLQRPQVALWGSAQVKRFVVAYWCFYHAGFSAWLSEHEGAEYWQHMLVAAKNQEASPVGGKWPRGKERRHFRGADAENAVHKLATEYRSPEEFVDYVSFLTQNADGSTNPNVPQLLRFADVRQRVLDHFLFGPWIAFKVGDMLERCLGIPVSFEQSEIFLFKDPHEAALMVWRAKQGLPEEARPKNAESENSIIRGVIEHLQRTFVHHAAPPDGRRALGLQEIETILCKWKSHSRGHYPLLNDIHEINEGIVPWGERSLAARQFHEAMPTGEDEL